MRIFRRKRTKKIDGRKSRTRCYPLPSGHKRTSESLPDGVLRVGGVMVEVRSRRSCSISAHNMLADA